MVNLLILMLIIPKSQAKIVLKLSSKTFDYIYVKNLISIFFYKSQHILKHTFFVCTLISLSFSFSSFDLFA